MNVTVNFRKLINHRSTFKPHGHLRTLRTKVMRMPTHPSLNTILTIDGEKYRVVEHANSLHGKTWKHIIGVVAHESK